MFYSCLISILSVKSFHELPMNCPALKTDLIAGSVSEGTRSVFTYRVEIVPALTALLAPHRLFQVLVL